MSDPGPPPPPPRTPSSASSNATGWKVATVVAAVMGLVLSGTVYALMDQRVSDARAERDAARDRLAEQPGGEDGGLGDLGDLLGEGGLDDLGELLGDGEIGELLGGGEIDPKLFECLGALGTGGDGADLPGDDTEAQVAAIQELVEAERELPPAGDLDVELVSRDEVRRRAVEITSGDLDPERAAVDSRLLAALGAVEPGTDLARAQLDALDAGVGGFYDPETRQLVIGSEEMDGLGVLVTAHELVHALTDATFGLPDQEAIAKRAGSDAAYAALNAVEGDASLYGQRFVGQHLPLDELLALQLGSAQAQGDLDELPHFVARQLEFPYLEGMTFTCDVFLDGGWEAVDATYDTVPATTAQILFPQRYRAGEAAVDVRDPAGPDSWDELRGDTFGAADLLFLLEAPGDDEGVALSDPVERVTAWAGGEVSVWGRGDDTATALVLADRGEATPLCDTVTDFYAAAFPDAARSGEAAEDGVVFEDDAQTAVVRCDGVEVALGTGPDVATARAAIASDARQ